MKKLKIAIEALSPIQLGFGKADVVVDAEAVHDELGMPFFPGKRFKGLLYESALEVAEMASSMPEPWFTKADIDILFGQQQQDIFLYVSNFYLEDYEKKCQDWEYLEAKYPSVFSSKDVWDTYTTLRFQTSIDDKGIVVDGSLRNMRVVAEGTVFFGELFLTQDGEKSLKIIECALKNLRFAGGNRNRGCGRIQCKLM